jgi:hypothetical protein
MNRRLACGLVLVLGLGMVLGAAGCDEPGSSVNDSVVVTSTPAEAPGPAAPVASGSAEAPAPSP